MNGMPLPRRSRLMHGARSTGEQDDYLTKLLRDRRALLENAENKIGVLEAALQHEDLRTLQHTLIYASDKAPKQLEAVNALLRSHGILFHQITDQETADRNKTAKHTQVLSGRDVARPHSKTGTR